MTDSCSRCGCAPLAECVNGHIILDDNSSRTCSNLAKKFKREAIRELLGPKLIDVERLKESPLGVEHLSQNLFITGLSYQGFLPHLRYVLVRKWIEDESFRYQMVDDKRLKEVWVGDESYKHAARIRDLSKIVNNTTQLVDEHYHLVIIHLGHLASKNVAAPSLLREALMTRETLGMPTWLVESFKWERSKDEKVEAYVAERYQEIAFEGAVVSKSVETYLGEDTEEPVTLYEEPEKPKTKAPVKVDEDVDLLENETKAAENRKWKKFKNQRRF